MALATQARRPPRRFRRRLLAVLLGAGLLPLLGWGLLGFSAATRLTGLSLAKVEPVLDRAQDALRGRDPALEARLREARLSLAQAELARRSLARLLPVAMSVALLGSALLLAGAALLLGKRLSTPIEQLAEGMERLGRGELGHVVPERAGDGGDELQLLVRRFNGMARELLAQRERLRLTENLAAWQGVARGLAHELKNPLTAMKLALARVGKVAERAASSPAPDAATDAERLHESVALLGEELDVLLRMTESFSQFARLPAPQPRPIDLAALLRETCALWRDASVPVECEAAPLTLAADPDQLRRAFGNLIKNAVEASRPGDGPVRVVLAVQGLCARVTVSDCGPGIPARIEGAQMLSSLGSTKPHGSGLGLPIAQKIVHDHGGTLSLEPRPERGAQAVVELPL